MAPVAKYIRILNSEPAEDEQRLLELSPSTAFRDGRSERFRIQQAPSPWNAECITRLLFLFVVSMIAIGFVIHNLPGHMDHDHHQHDCNEEEEHHTVYHEAAVASGQQECSDVGAQILKDGGNAVDAAIATVLCQGVVEPYYSGIGGGFIMTIYNHTTKSTTCINAREKAPAAATPDMFIGTNDTVKGAKSIGVPGELRGIEYAYNKYGGGLDWTELFEPAILKAKDGFKVSGSMEEKLIEYKDLILADEVFCAVYCNDDKTGVKKEGDTVKNLLLANTLEEIQANGVKVFYEGWMADNMTEEIKAQNGIFEVKDFEDYTVIELPAIEIELPNAGYTIHAPPLPFGGAVFGAILSIMDLFDVSSLEFDQNKTLQWHRTDEAFRHAYGLRYSMGDPDFFPAAKDTVRNVTSGEFAKSAKRKIFDDKTFHAPAYYGATFLDPGLSSTSHSSVLAPNKDAVSVTSTINYHFGSTIMSKSTGVVFNNEMDDFSFPTGQHPHDDFLSKGNQIEGGKRPLSSMSPLIFLDENKESTFIIGAAGGIHIPTSVANVMLRLLYFGTDDFDEPIRARRIHDSLLPDVLGFEDGFDQEILDSLRKIGHNVEIMTAESHVNGIKNHGNHIHAFSDLRNKGAGTSGW